MIVLGYNSGLCCRRFQPRFSPPWVRALQGVIPDTDTDTLIRRGKLNGNVLWDEEKSFRERDPYNVSGVWSRVSRPIYLPFPTPLEPMKRAIRLDLVELIGMIRLSAFSTTTTSTPSTSPTQHSNTLPLNRAIPSSQTKPSATSSWISKSPLSCPQTQKTRPTPSSNSVVHPAPSTRRGIRMQIRRFGDRSE